MHQGTQLRNGRHHSQASIRGRRYSPGARARGSCIFRRLTLNRTHNFSSRGTHRSNATCTAIVRVWLLKSLSIYLLLMQKCRKSLCIQPSNNEALLALHVKSKNHTFTQEVEISPFLRHLKPQDLVYHWHLADNRREREWRLSHSRFGRSSSSISALLYLAKSKKSRRSARSLSRSCVIFSAERVESFLSLRIWRNNA